jgi:hypothetical protein
MVCVIFRLSDILWRGIISADLTTMFQKVHAAVGLVVIGQTSITLALHSACGGRGGIMAVLSA